MVCLYINEEIDRSRPLPLATIPLSTWHLPAAGYDYIKHKVVYTFIPTKTLTELTTHCLTAAKLS